MRWKFPILRKLQAKYRELGLIKFALWFFFIWFGIKVLIVNIIAILFFGAEPFPFLRELGFF